MLAQKHETYVPKFLQSGLAQLQGFFALAQVRRRYPTFEKLVSGLGRGQLTYEPRASLENGRITGVEARRRPDHDLLPAEVLTIAESMGLLATVDRKRLDEACTSLNEWEKKGIALPRLSLDFSGQSLCRFGFPEMVCELLDSHDLEPSRLEIEVSERAIATDPRRVEKALWKLNGLGVRLSLDNFGRDEASLNFLRRFPFSTIKLDADLIDLAPQDEEEGAMVASIIVVAHAMNITVVALGVETEEQKDFLIENGCFQIQGPHMGDGLSADEFFDFCLLLDRVALAPGNVDIDRTDPEFWAPEC